MSRDNKKYHKYKQKYVNTKKCNFIYDDMKTALTEHIQTISDGPMQSTQIDWWIFFDLLQVSEYILQKTLKDDIIILVGDTPSYLQPFLEFLRTTYILPFSNKPFGCFVPPYSDHVKEKSFREVFTPRSEDDLLHYFNYLDKKTILTKEFVSKNWNKIVLIDSSNGASIMGVSIFFNRYVGNITDVVKGVIDCTYVTGSKPMQFIRLLGGHHKVFNMDPASVKQIMLDDPLKHYVINYRSDLIIYLGEIKYIHRDLFMINDAYPRLVPFYSVLSFGIDPDKVEVGWGDDGVANIEILRDLFKIYKTIKLDHKIASKDLSKIKKISPKCAATSMKTIMNFFDNIYLTLLGVKAGLGFEIKE